MRRKHFGAKDYMKLKEVNIVRNRQRNQILASILLMVGLFHSSGASDTLVVEQVEKDFDENVFYELLHNDEIWDNAEKRKKKILETDVNRLQKKAIEIGQPPEIEKSTLYMRNDMFRMDSESPSGSKISAIFRKDQGMVYQIDWDARKVYKMAVAEMEEMHKDFKQKMEKMKQSMPPGMEGMLAQLPQDQQDAIKQAMGSGGDSSPKGSSKQPPPTLIETGNTKDIKDFPKCSEFKTVNGNNVTIIWAYGGKPRISKMLHETFKEINDSFTFNNNDETDPIELVPKDKFPVLTFNYDEDRVTRRINFEIIEVLSVKESKVPLSVFEAYSDPSLTEDSITDQMRMK